MGTVVNHLRDLIAAQVAAAGIVVWYDTDGSYAEVVDALSLQDVRFVRYEDSFYALRAEIDDLLDGEEPPRLLVYVPLDPADTHHALAELEAAGVVMRPGQQPPARNTRLALVVRNALRPILGEEQADAIAKEVERGKLSLAEVEGLAERTDVGKTAVLSSIFGTASAGEMALAFLSSDAHDAALQEKGALQELANALGVHVGAEFAGADVPAELRSRLVQHVLATDLAVSLGGELPGALAGLPIAEKPASRDACAHLALAWRAGRELGRSYARQAAEVEHALQVGALDLSLEELLGTETFQALELRCQSILEDELLRAPRAELVEAAEARQSSFWSSHEPVVQARWALVATVGRLLLAAQRTEKVLESPPDSAEEFLAAYASGDEPLCLLDTHHRHMEQRVHQFHFGMAGEHAGLEKLVAMGRERYSSVAANMAESFLRQYQVGGFQAGKVLRQWEVLPEKVRDALKEGKTAYMLVDALRFEMCRELLSGLGEDCEWALEPAIAAVPSITSVGMGALVTGAEERLSVCTSEDGKLRVTAGTASVTTREARMEHLAEVAGVKMHAAHLEDLLPVPSSRTRKAIAGAELVVLTSQEIDSVCEQGNSSLARRMMGDLLQQLRRAVQVVSELGAKRVVIAADHGYLFLQELGDDMKIDAPGGQTVELHRRAWLGKGGSSSPSLMRAELTQLGLGGDLEIAVPWGFGCLKVAGGGTTYFHGGMSLQEMVVPVATVRMVQDRAVPATKNIAWSLKPGTDRITTRFVSVQIEGMGRGLFAIDPPRAHVEIRSGETVVSQAVSASYGFDEGTGDVQLQSKEDDDKKIEPNTVTLMLVEEPEASTVSLHLLDAATGRELAHLSSVEVLLSI